MAGSKESRTADTGLLSRRQAIVGALALAAGALIATRPEPAAALNFDPVLAGGNTYASAGTTLYLNNPGTPIGTEWAQAMINRNGITANGPVAAFGGVAMAASPPESTGIWGFAYEVPHFGVHAEHYRAAGTALRVDGRTKFSRSGRAYVSKGHLTATVTVPSGVDAGSIILVTLQGSAGVGNHVRYAKRLSSTTFQVMLTKAASVKVAFGWMILN
jgi:hypothetical protein